MGEILGRAVCKCDGCTARGEGGRSKDQQVQIVEQAHILRKGKNRRGRKNHMGITPAKNENWGSTARNENWGSMHTHLSSDPLG